VRELTRRQTLATLGTSGLAGLAGCGSLGESSSKGSEAELEEVPWPEVSGSETNRWKLLDERSKYRGETAGVKTYTKTRRWEDARLRRMVSKETLGKFDRPITQFFATTVDLRGTLTAAAGVGKILDNVAPAFRKNLTNAGIQNVRQPQDLDFSTPSPAEDAQTREFRGHYPTPEISKTVTIPDAGEKTVTLEAGELPVRGFTTAWKVKSGRAFIAGGAHPTKDYEGGDRLSVTSKTNDGIDIIIDIDLGLNPSRMESRINDLVSNVSADW
jgi:hypothetical protein